MEKCFMACFKLINILFILSFFSFCSCSYDISNEDDSFSILLDDENNTSNLDVPFKNSNLTSFDGKRYHTVGIDPYYNNLFISALGLARKEYPDEDGSNLQIPRYFQRSFIKIYPMIDNNSVSGKITINGRIRSTDEVIILKSNCYYYAFIEYIDENGKTYEGEMYIQTKDLKQKLSLELKKTNYDYVINLSDSIKLKMTYIKDMDFYIGVTPVTQAEYEAVMQKNPSRFIAPNNPVEQVTWYDAVLFCEKLNALTKNKRPNGYIFSLPTEEQWEYSCRANTKTLFYYGNEVDPQKMNSHGFVCVENKAVFNETKDRTTAVRSYTPNQFGLYDMHGNVWEWCLDSFNFETASEATYLSKAILQNALKVKDSWRNIRGGSWASTQEECQSGRKNFAHANDKYCTIGFRIVLRKINTDL